MTRGHGMSAPPLSAMRRESFAALTGALMHRGGLTDGLYFPWDADNHVARKVCDLLDTDTYDSRDFILEGGSDSQRRRGDNPHHGELPFAAPDAIPG